LGIIAWGFLRAGLSEGRVAARDCDELQRALTNIVILIRMRRGETHYETVVIAIVCQLTKWLNMHLDIYRNTRYD